MKNIKFRWVFTHGDITPRNVLVGPDRPALIDWEWAGPYPDGYELAFLWYILADLPASRDLLADHVETDPTAFWLSALLVQLLHLEWTPEEFQSARLETRDRLLGQRLDSH